MTGQAVTRGMAGLATVSLSSLRKPSAALARAVSDAFGLTIAGDGDAYAWQAPETLPAVLIREATAMAVELREALAPAADGVKLAWMIELGKLVAGNMGVGDVTAKVAAYARLLDQPRMCFTMMTLKDAGYRFKFWPAFAELAAFLDEYTADNRIKLRRFDEISRKKDATNMPIKTGKMFDEMTTEERRLHEDRLEAALGSLRSASPQRQRIRSFHVPTPLSELIGHLPPLETSTETMLRGSPSSNGDDL